MQVRRCTAKTRGAVMTPEEAKIALRDYIAYFDTYKIDEQTRTVTHHRQDNIKKREDNNKIREIRIRKR